jgi:hypothetical protein
MLAVNGILLRLLDPLASSSLFYTRPAAVVSVAIMGCLSTSKLLKHYIISAISVTGVGQKHSLISEVPLFSILLAGSYFYVSLLKMSLNKKT